MAKRYDQLVELVRKEQPRVIVEVGVHRAMRARAMCEAVKGPVHYIGFDVFDTLGEQYQADALNGKGMTTEAKARERLDDLKARKPGFTYELVIGDTRDTLHGRKVECDFAFIDGDHRVDAIRGDYAALAGASVVVFDDYYTGNGPDLTQYGANVVADEAGAEVLAAADQCKHGGDSHLAVVRQ